MILNQRVLEIEICVFCSWKSKIKRSCSVFSIEFFSSYFNIIQIILFYIYWYVLEKKILKVEISFVFFSQTNKNILKKIFFKRLKKSSSKKLISFFCNFCYCLSLLQFLRIIFQMMLRNFFRYQLETFNVRISMISWQNYDFVPFAFPSDDF